MQRWGTLTLKEDEASPGKHKKKDPRMDTAKIVRPFKSQTLVQNVRTDRGEKKLRNIRLTERKVKARHQECAKGA